MKKQGMFLFFILFIFYMFIPAQGLTAEKIDFKSYNKGIKLVKDLNKKGFIYFSAVWCPPCKELKKKTFADKKVIEYLNDNFVSIKVDIDKEEKITKKYDARRIPKLYFLNEDGSELTFRLGYVEPKEFLYTIKYINTESYKQMNFKDFIKQN